jgi:predicted Na+-dependent transporter
MVIVTILNVQFVFPSIVYLLLGSGSEFEIPVIRMIFLLTVALFIPISAGWFAKRYWPSIVKKLTKDHFLSQSSIYS